MIPKILFVIVYVICFIININNISVTDFTYQLLFVCSLTALINTTIIYSPYFLFKYAFRNTNKKIVEECMSEIDFSNKKEYYRNILKKYSPIELSYIDDFRLSGKKDIIASILNLKLKNKIEINNKKLVTVDKNIDNLKPSEKYILENIRDGILRIDNLDTLIKIAHEDCYNDKLIVEKNQNTDNNKELKQKLNKKEISFLIIFIIVLSMFLVYIVNLNKSILIGVILILFLVIFFVFIPYNLLKNIFYTLFSGNSKKYIRSNSGEEINKKIEGLKRFIYDFSSLNQKKSKELELWDEYLIYSVLFGINDVIINELDEFIEISNDREVYYHMINRNVNKLSVKECKQICNDLLSKYSPLEIYYILNLTIQTKNAMIATLLSLAFKNKISITEKGLKILDKSCYNLLCGEKYILDHIVDGKLKINNLKELNKILIKSLSNKKLIEVNYYINIHDLELKLFTSTIIATIVLIIEIIIFKSGNIVSNINVLLMLLCLFTAFGISLSYLIKYIEAKVDSAPNMTDSGTNIKKQVLNFKNQYVINYASNSHHEELNDEILIFSVLFDVNNELHGVLSKFIKLKNNLH